MLVVSEAITGIEGDKKKKNWLTSLSMCLWRRLPATASVRSSCQSVGSFPLLFTASENDKNTLAELSVDIQQQMLCFGCWQTNRTLQFAVKLHFPHIITIIYCMMFGKSWDNCHGNDSKRGGGGKKRAVSCRAASEWLTQRPETPVPIWTHTTRAAEKKTGHAAVFAGRDWQRTNGQEWPPPIRRASEAARSNRDAALIDAGEGGGGVTAVTADTLSG